jgi:hypothetical protein
MRKFYIPVVAAACLFTVPALAATSTTGATTGAPAKPAPDSAQIQEALQQDLTKAGYTDIRIVPGSFFVRAKDKQGNEIEMMIRPHSMTEITAVNESSAATAHKTSDSVAPSVQTSK